MSSAAVSSGAPPAHARNAVSQDAARGAHQHATSPNSNGLGLLSTYRAAPTTSSTFTPPPKGFFAAPSSSSVSAAANAYAANSGSAVSDAPGDAMLPSSVPSKGRRRESLSAQMRKGASSTADTVSAAGGAGARPIPLRARSPSSVGVHNGTPGRYGTSPRVPASADLSTSFGAAAEALSLSRSSGPLLSHSFAGSGPSGPSARYGASVSSATTTRPISVASKGVAAPASLSSNSACESGSHTHFGVECTGPTSFDASLPNVPPSQAALAQLKASSEAADARRGRRTSTATDTSSIAADVREDQAGQPAANTDQLLHRCESCAKVYRHPSCLIKHRWEHTVYWKEASKFLLSKHQQVQLLEAAAILVGMDSHSRSLPEEKALWPAAVSPPSSGLLGSDVFNYEKLMEGRRLRQQQQQQQQQARAFSPSMSPLNNLSQLHIDASSPPPATAPLLQASAVRTARATSKARSARDGSAETTPEEDLMEDVTRSSTSTALEGRSSSTHTSVSGAGTNDAADSPGRMTHSSGSNEQDDDVDDEDDSAHDTHRYGMASGGEVFAELDMDE